MANETESVVQTAQAAARPSDLKNGLSTVVVPLGHKLLVLSDEVALDEPNRKTGHFTFFDAASMASYLNTHKVAGTTLYANDRTASVEAVINDHNDAGPGWADHVAELKVRPIDAWTAWTSQNDKMLSQEDFAEHIERHLIDIVEPAGADLLELAQTFQATTKVEFRQSRLLANGQKQFEYSENVDAKGGQRGELTIPKEFKLGISPFVGCDRYAIAARLRVRIAEGHLRLGYILDNPADVEREAFADVTKQLSDAVGIAALNGIRKPASTRSVVVDHAT